MNWHLFWALVICFGLIAGNLMLIKHMDKFKMPHKLNQLKNKDEHLTDNENKGNVTTDKINTSNHHDNSKPEN